jgi:hypothetical protein
MFQLLPAVERMADVMTDCGAGSAETFRCIAEEGRSGANAILRDAHGDRSASLEMPSVRAMRKWLRFAGTARSVLFHYDTDWVHWFESVGAPSAQPGPRPSGGRVTEGGPLPPPLPTDNHEPSTRPSDGRVTEGGPLPPPLSTRNHEPVHRVSDEPWLASHRKEDRYGIQPPSFYPPADIADPMRSQEIGEPVSEKQYVPRPLAIIAEALPAIYDEYPAHRERNTPKDALDATLRVVLPNDDLVAVFAFCSGEMDATYGYNAENSGRHVYGGLVDTVELQYQQTRSLLR